MVTDKREIKCDTVILATRTKPEVELARKAGLKIGRLGGIEVDKGMLSSVSDVYAYGDCVETEDLVSGEKALNLLWRNAKQQAEAAANNCLGGHQKYPGSINVTGVDIFDVQGVSIGITASSIAQEANKLEIIEKSRGLDYLRLIIYDQVLVGVQAINKIKELGSLLSVILRKEGLKLPEKGSSIFPYLLQRHRLSQYLSRT